jgi:hypothetical protein
MNISINTAQIGTRMEGCLVDVDVCPHGGNTWWMFLCVIQRSFHQSTVLEPRMEGGQE